MNEIQSQPQAAVAPRTVKELFRTPSVIERFTQLFSEDKSKATGYMTNVLNAWSNNALLMKADPMTVLNAALVAAAMDLPITPGLGQAALVPFNNRKAGRTECQFQIMTRGYVQLAMRTRQYKHINAGDVKEGEIVGEDFLTGEMEFKRLPAAERAAAKTIGYFAFFELTNGFRKTLYMTKEELTEHSKKYSQTAKAGYGLWVENFDAMATKTVLKLILSKWGVLSTEMERAVTNDGAVIRETSEGTHVPDFADNAEDVMTAEVVDEETGEIIAETESNVSAIEAAMAQTKRK